MCSRCGTTNLIACFGIIYGHTLYLLNKIVVSSKTISRDFVLAHNQQVFLYCFCGWLCSISNIFQCHRDVTPGSIRDINPTLIYQCCAKYCCLIEHFTNFMLHFMVVLAKFKFTELTQQMENILFHFRVSRNFLRLEYCHPQKQLLEVPQQI